MIHKCERISVQRRYHVEVTVNHSGSPGPLHPAHTLQGRSQEFRERGSKEDIRARKTLNTPSRENSSMISSILTGMF